MKKCLKALIYSAFEGNDDGKVYGDKVLVKIIFLEKTEKNICTICKLMMDKILELKASVEKIVEK